MSTKKKLFVVSDIHSFYTPLVKALNKSGFDANNENHWLIVCGDAFDRGDESKEVLHFLMSLERKVLIRGNHDTLLEQCCEREFPYGHDFSNGTVKTIESIGGAKQGKPFYECCQMTLARTQAYRDQLVNYFETKNYIFVHSWIPVTTDHEHGEPYNPDWRNATRSEWDDAMWGNPFNMYVMGFQQEDKILVFGHWHCSYGHTLAGHCKDEFIDAVWEPYYAKGIIGIDRCTAHTKEVNVVVLEDEFI